MASTGFSGTALHTIDPKGRIFIPANYRERLGENFTICLNNDMRSIAFYPKEQWEIKCREHDLIPEADRRGRNYVRVVLEHAYEDVNLDSQGRVLIPSELRAEFLKDCKEAKFIGMRACLELWNPEKYKGLLLERDELIDGTLDYIYETYFREKLKAE